jgi:hypothetical protein
MLSIIDNSRIDVTFQSSRVGCDFCIRVCKTPAFERLVKVLHILVRLSHWGAVVGGSVGDGKSIVSCSSACEAVL